MMWLSFLLVLLTPLHSAEETSEKDSQLYLSINIEDGAYLQLSNGDIYQISPKDMLYSAYWITPFPLSISESDDSDYPTKITNLNSGSSVRGRKIDKNTLLNSEFKKMTPLEPPSQETPTTPYKRQPSPEQEPLQEQHSQFEDPDTPTSSDRNQPNSNQSPPQTKIIP